jgi:hypothetical protein
VWRRCLGRDAGLHDNDQHRAAGAATRPLRAPVPALAATLAWERRLGRRGGEPLLDLGLFRNRSFSAGLAINITFMLSFSSFMFVLTLLLQAGFHDSPLRAGLTFLQRRTSRRGPTSASWRR